MAIDMRVPVIGAKKYAEPYEVEDPQTGEKICYPTVCVVSLSPEVLGAIVQNVVNNVVPHVVTGVIRELQFRGALEPDPQPTIEQLEAMANEANSPEQKTAILAEIERRKAEDAAGTDAVRLADAETTPPADLTPERES